ncbi:MAG: HAMP domain-containing sensor histidine kinase, partial [Polyangiaceae bacterium]
RELKVFSRGEDVPRSPIDIHRVLDQCLAMVDSEVRHRARITREYGCKGNVLGNEARLGQVFLNLLVNALQALPEGDIEGNEVRVVTRPGGPGQVIIEICDTGSGIPENIRERIFEPFFTTKAPGVGTGLGLSISHHLVTGLGGTIAIDPRGGRGTTFRVTLGGDR